ncbi:MAG: Hpt domain-containing protein [Alphaproteobacteria bacterium]|nr:Hpt domain-containing protein [Alphaproteobacteria bacterium]
MTDILNDYEKAMAVLDDLAKDYLVWVQTDLENLEKAFLQAQQTSGEQRKSLIRENLFRTAHDMKGQGATFGYDLVTDIGNHLCRYIERFDDFDEKQMNEIKIHVEALRQIIDEALIHDGGEKGAFLKQKVEAL